jgi:hypothetical protein
VILDAQIVIQILPNVRHVIRILDLIHQHLLAQLVFRINIQQEEQIFVQIAIVDAAAVQELEHLIVQLVKQILVLVQVHVLLALQVNSL